MQSHKKTVHYRIKGGSLIIDPPYKDGKLQSRYCLDTFNLKKISGSSNVEYSNSIITENHESIIALLMDNGVIINISNEHLYVYNNFKSFFFDSECNYYSYEDGEVSLGFSEIEKLGGERLILSKMGFYAFAGEPTEVLENWELESKHDYFINNSGEKYPYEVDFAEIAFSRDMHDEHKVFLDGKDDFLDYLFSVEENLKKA